MADYAENALIRGLHFLAENQATVAHNLANVSSNGYKRRIAVAAPTTGNFNDVRTNPAERFTEALDWSLGSLNITGNRAHLAIKGEQFLKVSNPTQTKTWFARPNHLLVNESRQLVTQSGHLILGAGDQPITIDDSEGSSLADMKIAPNGLIIDSRARQPVGSLGVYEIPDRSALRAHPGGLFEYQGTTPPIASKTAEIVQGALEQSNVQPTNELINMIAVQRSFQADMKALTTLGKIKDSYVATFNR